MRKLKNKFSKKSLRDSALILLITIFLLELLGLFVGKNDYFWHNRQMMIPSMALRPVGNDGLWTYRPNIAVDSAATYYFSENDGWLEYRCRFNTNKFGLVDTNYDNQKSVELLVLGDSFTEGQGGCPWLTREALAKANYSKIILNGGLQGANIERFKMLADWLEKQIKIKDVVVIAISNDFKRKVDRNWAKDNQKKMNSDYWNSMLAVSDDDLLKIGADMYRSANKSFWAKINDNLRYYSTSYRLLSKPFQVVPDDLNPAPEVIERNLTALRELRKKYPRLKIILVPQRDEVGLLGRKNQDTKFVEKFLTDEKFNFSRCELTLSDYMKIDGHPNKQGYAKIFQCFNDLYKSN